MEKRIPPLRCGMTNKDWHVFLERFSLGTDDEPVTILHSVPFAVERGSLMATIKAHTEYLTFQTDERYEMVHITPQVEEIVRRSGIEDGLCFVSPMHITAAIYVNDNEDGLIEDIGTWLEKLAPAWPGYKHHRTGEDNADAHLKALLLHHETTLPVTRGRLDLGTWQRVFYAEFDGQRSKRVIVKLLGVARG
jgi:secondary thiamine-phosphate synthase enzyme